MRIIVTLLLLVSFSLISTAQITLSPEEWREDLMFFQEKIHQEYPFLFKKIEAEEFDAAVAELHRAIPDLEQHEIVVGFARLVSLFAYGHTNLRLTGWAADNPYGFHQMPFNLYSFSDGWYVQAVPKAYEAALGAKVLAVEGMSIEEALAAIRPVVAVENEQFFKAFGWYYLGTPEVLHAQGVTEELKSEITLTLEKDGKTFEQSFAAMELDGYPGQYSLIHEAGDWLDARDNTSTPLWLKQLERIYYYEYLPEQKAVYVRHSQIQDDPSQDIPAFYEEVFSFIEDNEVERLILDVRLNGGGNNYKNKPILTGVIASEKINKPGSFFVILGRRTYSACQNLVNELDNYTEAIFVGEPTAENINFYGDNRLVRLPNSGLVPRISFAWWQDKPQWENAAWLAPHLAVDMSFADYETNHDPVLEAIWEYQDTDALVDPMAHLTDLYLAGKMDQIAPAAKKFHADNRYRYYPFEDRLNQTGYNLMNHEDYESAIFVFQLTAELYPDSANAWDSLAEAHWRSGKKEDAIALYQKALKMDPEGPTGENAAQMLEKIAAEKD